MGTRGRGAVGAACRGRAGAGRLYQARADTSMRSAEGGPVMKTIAAVYENGVFRPKDGISLAPGCEVEVILPDTRDPAEILRERFPNSFGGLPDDEAEAMRRVIEEECERIEPLGRG